jgi:small subunit ribosomal protein S3
LGILRDWKSRWFGARGDYQKYLKADVLLREFLEKKLRGNYVESIEMERGENNFRVIIKTSRPGVIIGRSGEGTASLKKDILSFLARLGAETSKDMHLDIVEVRFPESHAAIAAQMIAEGLEKRLPFRRVVKQMMDKIMANKSVHGAKIALSGRLGGAEMSRAETLKRGRIPLQTLRADVDFARERAHLYYGEIGIKVWIYKGEVFGQAE